MAKLITIDDEAIAKFLSEVGEQLKKTRHAGSINMTKTLGSDDRTAALIFSPWAFAKMATLIMTYSTEVEWHGLVRRLSDDVFEVYDVLSFPHEVTGVTVTSDEATYSAWLDTLDDETFNAMRFHGHSHVNMGVTPSGVDMKYRMDKVKEMQAPDESTDSFYAFVILNKKLEIEGEIYDITKNALYSTTDKSLIIDVMGGGDSISDFLDETKKLVTEKTYSTSAPGTTKKGKKSSYYYDYGYDETGWDDDYPPYNAYTKPVFKK